MGRYRYFTNEYPRQLISNNITLDSPYWLRELSGNLSLFYANLSMKKLLKFRKFLLTSQYFPLWKLEQYQKNRLKLLLSHAYKYIPYYTDLFVKNNLTPEDFNSVKDIKKLPLLTKEDIIKNFDKLISPAIKKKYLFCIKTSGTTGTPVQFYRDMRTQYIDSAFYRRMLASFGITPYHRKVYIWLRPFVLNHITDKYIYDPNIKLLTLATFHKGLPYWGEKLELIRRFKPVHILASPSVLYDFACYSQEHNINNITFRCIFSSFENIFPYQRELIEKQFNCKVYNFYISQERVLSAWECLQQNGMHIDMERGVTEIVDDKGELLSDGASGRVIATPFHNFAMPLIRYDTGDVGSISEIPCLCARGLPLLKSIDGRTSERIRYKNKLVCSSAFSAMLCRFKNIKECQFIQETEEEIKINIVKRADYSERDTQELIQTLKQMIDERLNIVISFMDYIPRTKMGKFPFIISRIKHK